MRRRSNYYDVCTMNEQIPERRDEGINSLKTSSIIPLSCTSTRVFQLFKNLNSISPFCAIHPTLRFRNNLCNFASRTHSGLIIFPLCKRRKTQYFRMDTRSDIFMFLPQEGESNSTKWTMLMLPFLQFIDLIELNFLTPYQKRFLHVVS